MKKSTFAETQIVNLIKEYEADMDTAEICREHGNIKGYVKGVKDRKYPIKEDVRQSEHGSHNAERCSHKKALKPCEKM
jgi:hypothetical protein